MTQRYAHLRDEALKNGDRQIDDVFKQQESEDDAPDKVVNIQGRE